MKKYYCIDLEFIGVELDKYFSDSNPVQKIHHAHLYILGDEIKVELFFEHNTKLGDKIMNWVGTINIEKFGSFIKVSNESQNRNLQKIDFSEAKLVLMNESDCFLQGDKNFLIFNINTVKFYWNPNKIKTNTGEFYLNDNGFKIVAPLYSLLRQKDKNFSINIYEEDEDFYDLDKSKFRFEFEFSSTDVKATDIITIKKISKIKFKYDFNVTKKDAISYGQIVCTLASFYYHRKINCTQISIYLAEYEIMIVKIEKKIIIDNNNYLYGFNVFKGFNQFLKSDWQINSIKHIKILSKSIELFNQAMLVDDNSQYLIRYNILELCDILKTKNEKFNVKLNSEDKNQCYNDALNILKKTINKEDYRLFETKWKSVKDKLEFKPMISPLDTFFKSKNLKIDEFPISTKNLKQLRDNITHGSIDKVDEDDLSKANVLLYRINCFIILDLIGIKNSKIDLTII